jgi:6-phosphogluconolactonase
MSDLHIFDDPAALAEGAANWLLARALATPGRFAVSLAGGNTPRALYQHLGQEPILGRFPWARTHWFWGDERCVPPDDPASNYGMALHAFLSAAPVPADHIHPILTERMSPVEAAAAYQADLMAFHGSSTLAPDAVLFDVMLLGIGDDGHTASLLPGQPVLAERTRWVAEVPSGRAEARVTLTYPALDASRCVVFLVSGAGKRDILQAVRGGADVPAAKIRPRGETLYFADRAAAGA